MTLTVSILPRDGSWVRLGTQHDGGFGVFPGSIEFDGDLSEYGALGASFRIRTSPKWARAHLEQFTPVVIMDGAEYRWSGRIIATPTTLSDDAAEVVVQCQGWGQHLKDDCTPREWVVDDLSRWFDQRSLPNANLTQFSSRGVVRVGDRTILCVLGEGYWAIGESAGVTFDAGPNNLVERVVIEYESSNNTNFARLYLQGTDDGNPSNSANFNVDPSGLFVVNDDGATGTVTLTMQTPRRYINVRTQSRSNLTFVNDAWFRLKSVRVFMDRSAESAGQSVLTASKVIADTLDEICPLIDPDRSRITPTSFLIPSFPGSSEWRYANELVDLANSFHGYLTRLTVDPSPVMEFAPLPTDYSYILGVGEYSLLEPAAQDGREVFNRVVAPFQDASGEEFQSVALDAQLAPIQQQLANAAFEQAVGSGNWQATTGTLALDPAVFYQGASSGLITTAANTYSGVVYNTARVRHLATNVVLPPGSIYTLRIAVRRRKTVTKFFIEPQASTEIDLYRWAIGVFDANSQLVLNTGTPQELLDRINAIPVNTWGVLDITFKTLSQSARPVIYIQLGASTSGAVMNIDAAQLLRPDGSVVSRRSFTRTALKPVQSRSTQAAADILSQLELEFTRFPPFKGTIGVTGRIRTKGGGSIAVSALPARVGDRVLLADQADPVTGALGRSGIIQRARYVEDEDRVELEIDSARNFLTNLKARLALLGR